MHSSWMTITAIAALAMGNAASAEEGDATTAGRWSGSVTLRHDIKRVSDLGPLAMANALQPGLVTTPSDATTALLELRGQGDGWLLDGALEQSSVAVGDANLRGQVRELTWNHDAGPWQFSVGRKIVGWDVGYAFRPNDVVQQETRRTLVSATPQGRPLLMAERYGDDSAWSLVWVNPLNDASHRKGDEPALAVRYYRRVGALDWHGFARWAQRTGASVGTAASWVASDALELHASLRCLRAADTLRADAPASAIVATNPWQPALTDSTAQALVGGTWTSATQFSVLFEAWWDGTAPDGSVWDAWRQRNASLAPLAAHGAPAQAVAGNLAWQADAFGASSSMQQRNVYLRLSWEYEGWQPSVDVLWHPQDGGRMVTTALAWKGDRWQIAGGWRIFGGPEASVVAQLPNRHQAYLQARWTF